MPNNFENQCKFFQMLFYGCHCITSNQIDFADMIDNSTFYSVRGVEVATIKSVWSNLHRLLLSKFLFIFVFEAKFWYVLGFYAN